MGQKRGMLLIVGIFLLLVPLSVISGEGNSNSEDPLAAGEAPDVAELYITYDDEGSCNSPTLTVTVHSTLAESKCGFPNYWSCYIRAEETGWSSDSGCATIRPGAIMLQKTTDDFIDKYGDTGAFCDYAKDLKTGDGNQYLCSESGWWKRCSSEDENKFAWTHSVDFSTSLLYKCILKDDVPTWKLQPGEDIDHDGHTTTVGDCDDNPEDDPNAENCPVLEEGSIDCQYPQHSTCAICINPGRPEVCGDGINNDCGGSNEPISQLEGKTSDNCNKFAAGCEQKSFATLNLEEEGEEEDNDNQEIDLNTIPHFNAQGESFSWTATPDGGYCCGYNDIEDLGKTVYSEAGGGYRVCLNTEEKLVGRESAIPNCDGDGEWCWATASSNKFNILTIKKPLKQPYDLVSNSQNWLACDENTAEGTQDLSLGLTDPSFRENANRFYCYREGEH